MSRKILIITSIGHFLCHAITLVFPAILLLIRDEFNITLVELGILGTIQFLFLVLHLILQVGYQIDLDQDLY